MSTDPHLDETMRQAYRAAAQAEPGPQLDARILQAAHAALETPARKPARWSWLVLPFSAAAVAIVVTTVVLQLRQTPSTPPLESASAPATQAAKPEVAAAKPEKKAERPAQAAPTSRAVRQNQAAQIAAAEEAQRRSDSEQLAAAAARAKQQAELKIAAAPPLARSVESAPRPVPSPAQPMAEADTPVGAAASGAARPSVAAAAPPAAKQAEPAADRLAETEAYSPPSKVRGPEKPTDKQLEDIRKLQREGKLEAAKKALAELRKQFPLFKVPEDLRGLIEPAAKGEK